MYSVFVLSVIMLSVIMLSVIMLSVIMLSVIMLSVIMLSVILLSVIMLSVIMLSVIILSVVMLNISYCLFQRSTGAEKSSSSIDLSEYSGCQRSNDSKEDLLQNNINGFVIFPTKKKIFGNVRFVLKVK
jgi:hypothetical protein